MRPESSSEVLKRHVTELAELRDAVERNRREAASGPRVSNLRLRKQIYLVISERFRGFELTDLRQRVFDVRDIFPTIAIRRAVPRAIRYQRGRENRRLGGSSAKLAAFSLTRKWFGPRCRT